MGRKSLADTRKTEILDAFEDCVVEHGLEASSFQRIAEVLEMDRAMIRHYFGSRDALVRAMIDRVIDRWASGLTSLAAEVPPAPFDMLVEAFFSPALQGHRAEALWAEVVAHSARSSSTRAALKAGYAALFRGVSDALARCFPDVSARERARAGFNIALLLERSGTFKWIGVARSAHATARELIAETIERLGESQERAAEKKTTKRRPSRR